ncbi:MAG TPA: septum formation initiator family protein [Thermoanaerobaculia bacterium]
MSTAPPAPKTPRPLAAFFLSLGASALVLGLLLISDGRVLELKRVKEETRQLDQQIDALKKENDQLRTSIDAAHRRGFPIEKVAREELHLVRPDDIVLLYPEGSISSEKPPAAATARRVEP